MLKGLKTMFTFKSQESKDIEESENIRQLGNDSFRKKDYK